MIKEKMLALHQKVISTAFISWFENWEEKNHGIKPQRRGIPLST